MNVQTQTPVAKVPTLAELQASVIALTARIEALESSAKSGSKKSDREMTDDDARNVLNGAVKDLKHGDAAEKLGLSYGQVYSARLEYTFRHIHDELKAKGFVNPWKKAKA